MKLNPQDLEKITNLTLEHYNQRAEDFWEGTRDHNVSQNIAAMLKYIEGEAHFTILDFGCGPGRDLKVFVDLGHIAVGLEGAAHFAVMARAHSGSNPHGHNEEGWNGGRYGVYHDLDTWRRYVSAAGFVELNHYYRPAGLPREKQPWLASVWRR